jgi:hypothetical protein
VYVSPCVFEPFVNEIYNNNNKIVSRSVTFDFHAQIRVTKHISFLFFLRNIFYKSQSSLLRWWTNHTSQLSLLFVQHTDGWTRQEAKKKKNLNLMNTNKQAKNYEMMRVIDNLMLYFVHMWTSALV